jgi:acetylornithine deacetylase/succinyl-diaminopimelate desuccinylase-like protein
MADPERWISDPFHATLHPDGRIIGRGTQDMKSVGTQYLEAVDILKKTGFQPNMNVYIVYVPDEGFVSNFLKNNRNWRRQRSRRINKK